MRLVGIDVNVEALPSGLCKIKGITMEVQRELSNEKQAIPIADLGVDQLTYFQRQLDQEIAFFTESLKELKVFESKFIVSEESVLNMYIPAKLSDPNNHLIEIGTGYFVEMNTEKAADYFRRKQAF
ncbi:BMA-PFD-5, isoform a [Dirofilaria immitis]|nr:BMA-PFD-5, isoform a [Dirofilaria immitis]